MNTTKKLSSLNLSALILAGASLLLSQVSHASQTVTPQHKSIAITEHGLYMYCDKHGGLTSKQCTVMEEKYLAQPGIIITEEDLGLYCEKHGGYASKKCDTMTAKYNAQ